MFTFRNPQAWGYPEGLGIALARQLQEQYVSIVAMSEMRDVMYVEVPQLHYAHGGTWSISDNGGELNVERVNSSLFCTVATTVDLGFVPLPSDVEKYAFVLLVRLLAVFRGQPVDYAFRP